MFTNMTKYFDFFIDIVIGKDLLLVENLDFSDIEFVCSQGAIPLNNACGIFRLLLLSMIMIDFNLS